VVAVTSDEAKAIVDELVAGDALPVMIGAAIAAMLDELQNWRDEDARIRAKEAERGRRRRASPKRPSADASADVRGRPPDLSHARAFFIDLGRRRKDWWWW
jgi:hypothetical protein